MKDRILEILNSVDRALNYEEIDSLLNNKSIEETREMSAALRELENEAMIYHTNKNKYMLFNESNTLKKGILQVNKRGYGFVIIDGEEDVFIPADNIREAIDEDLVVCEITKVEEDGKREGRIVKTIKRNIQDVVGEFYSRKGIGHIIPDDKSIKLDIEIPKKKNKKHTLLN